MKTLSALFLVISILPVSAFAWGPHGHELVAEIAHRHLDPQVKREIEKLLGDRADLALREASTWADGIRAQPQYRDTGPLHYVNFERGNCRYQARKMCRNGSCIVAGINRYVAQLLDRDASKAQRAEALAFVVHLVGDIHQPLHAGWLDDRGGNDFQVRYGREGSNLHALWDTTVIRHAGLRVREHADKLLKGGPVLAGLEWDSDAPADWAVESCRLVQNSVYPAVPDIDVDYLNDKLPIAEARIKLAGLRLASMLNQLLH